MVATLAACAARRPAPISEARPPATAVPKAGVPISKATLPPADVPRPVEGLKVHTIQKGDTLIGVALANGLDYRELAAWNNIENPNVIKLGETLRLTAPGSSAAGPADTAAVPPGAQPQPGAPVTAPLIITQVPSGAGTALANTDKLKTEPKAGKMPYTDAAYAKALAESTGAAMASSVSPAPSSVTSSASALVQPVPPASVAPLPSASDDVDWAWPLQPAPKGKIIAPFTDANKGVDIAGSKGTPILASAPGKVVYSGAGLRGYGRLVIIKHNATWLSAYAHNEKILVAEGAEVKKGQKIAEMGSSDADQVKLHFEIRKQGKPVDPMKFLPN